MASKYYNPQVARSLGAAYVKPYVSATAGVEKGMKRIIDFQKQKLEADKLAKENDNTNKILDALYKNKNKARVNAELLQGEWKKNILFGANKIKKNESELTNKVKSGEISKYDSLIEQDDLVNIPLTDLKNSADNYVAFVDAVNTTKESLSSSVSSVQAAKVNGILSGDKKVIDQVSKELNVEPNDLLEPSVLQKLGYRIADTSSINTLFDATQKAAQTAASKGVDMAGYIKKVEQDLSQLTLSDDQYLSAAFDFLGKETPGFVNPFDSYIDENIRGALDAKDPSLVKDINNNGSNIDEIKGFVHKAMIEGAKDAYEGFKKDYADKYETDPKPGETETNYYNDAGEMLQSVYDKLPTFLSGTKSQQDKERAAIEADKNLTKKEKEEKLKEIKGTSKALTTQAVINIVKEEPIFGDSEIEDPGAAKGAIIESLMADEALKYSKQEAEKFYDKKYGNALIIINGQPVNDINGLLSAYNRKLSAAKKLTNSQMKEIINNLNIGTDTTSKTDYSQYKTN